MSRRLPNLLAGVSLLLCAGVVVSWAASYLPEQFHLRSHHGRVLLIFAAKHHAQLFEAASRDFPLDQVLDHIRYETDPARGEGRVQARFAGFEVGLSDREYGFWFFAVPQWAIAVPLAGAAAWGLWRGRTLRRRAIAGHCLRCGYDLRGSPGRCPECGAAGQAA